MITALVNLRKSTQIFNAKFPLFILPKEALIEEKDGIVFLDGLCLDDRNIKSDKLGVRRLRSSYPNKAVLNKAVHDIPSMLKSTAKRYIDSEGTVFEYQKSLLVSLRYHKILKVEDRGVTCLVWIKGINSPFPVLRPPLAYMTWAGILYNGAHPWILYEFSEERKKDTKRKI
jgi:hypothetical protein